MRQVLRNKSTKRFLIVLGIAAIVFGIFGNVGASSAKGDVTTLLTNWFANKKTAAVKEIEVSIEEEKNLLMNQLGVALQVEIEAANRDLEAFTQQEIALRVANLQAYADELIANLQIDNSTQKSVIELNLDAIVANAIALMEGQETELSLLPIQPQENNVVEAPEEESPIAPPSETEEDKLIMDDSINK